jgi:hypothetical protein
MELHCECCQYNTKVKANFQKHLLTSKHKLKKENHSITGVYTKSINDTELFVESQPKVTPKSTQSQPKTAAAYSCKYCEQCFKFKQSMYRHIKYSCTKNNDEDLKELVRLLNLQLDTERKEREKVQKQLQSQSKQIEKLMGKLEIHGSFNNNTINNITLLAYRNTDVSHLKTEDYIGFYKKVNHCVKQLIEKIHFNPEKPENMNIYISNMKDKYITVYDGSNWNLSNKNEELTRLYEEKEQMLEEWLESNPNPALKEKFVKYLNNKESDDCLNHIMEEIKLMMYNKGQKRLTSE